jgi:hypothetical protein
MHETLMIAILGQPEGNVYLATKFLISQIDDLLVQFRQRFAFALILFLQYLHFTVCLMIGSSAASSAMLAMAYRARPTPMKLMILLRNDLINQNS